MSRPVIPVAIEIPGNPHPVQEPPNPALESERGWWDWFKLKPHDADPIRARPVRPWPSQAPAPNQQYMPQYMPPQQNQQYMPPQQNQPQRQEYPPQTQEYQPRRQDYPPQTQEYQPRRQEYQPQRQEYRQQRQYHQGGYEDPDPYGYDYYGSGYPPHSQHY